MVAVTIGLGLTPASLQYEGQPGCVSGFVRAERVQLEGGVMERLRMLTVGLDQAVPWVLETLSRRSNIQV